MTAILGGGEARQRSSRERIAGDTKITRKAASGAGLSIQILRIKAILPYGHAAITCATAAVSRLP